jgi:hypothetical protein
MGNTRLEQRKIITGILSAELSENDMRKMEHKLKTYRDDMEYGEVYQMELIDKIYSVLLERKLFTMKELFSLLYGLKFEYTLSVYYKMGLVNQLLNGGKYEKKIKRKYGGFKWSKE